MYLFGHTFSSMLISLPKDTREAYLLYLLSEESFY